MLYGQKDDKMHFTRINLNIVRRIVQTTRLVALWFVSGVCLGGCIAVLTGGVWGLLEGTADPTSSFIGGSFWFLMTFGSWLWMGWLPIVCLCAVWPLAARRTPSIEKPPAVAAILLSVVAVMTVVAWWFVLGAGTDPRVLAIPFMSFLIPLAFPRVVIRALRPGAFVAATA